jgi:hypothetical protein
VTTVVVSGRLFQWVQLLVKNLFPLLSKTSMNLYIQIFFFLFACFNLRDRGERWGLNVGFVTNLCCYVDHDISFIVILKLYFSNLLVMFLGSYSRFKMSNPQADPLLQVETTCGSLLYELQVLCESF